MKITNKRGKHSLGVELPLLFIILLALAIGTVIIWNNLFLRNFYISQKQKALVSAYDMIEDAIQSDYFDTSEFNLKLETVCDRYAVDVLVLDTDSEAVKYNGKDPDSLKIRLWDHLFLEEGGELVDKEDGDKVVLQTSDKYVVEVARDFRNGHTYVELWGNFTNGNMVLITSALEGIENNARIANVFIAYVGLSIMIVGAVLAWFITRKITSPLLELADISEKMAELNFDVRYSGDSQNEIGLLGANINKLSYSLEQTISELKSANIKLQKDIEAKEKTEEMRREFVSNVSHELKTPIAIIQGYAEGLSEGIDQDKDTRDYYCGVIADEASKMNHMVQKMITLNQIEFGEDIVELQRVNISELIRGCVDSIRVLTDNNGITVNLVVADAIYAWGDEYKIEEVLTNYISNAINHCENEKVIEIKVENYADKVRIVVFNTGTPIPEEAIGRIWDKFFKVDKARTRAYGGSGIGLSIVKAIMDSLNQQYGVSNYDDGVAFWFELDSVSKVE